MSKSGISIRIGKIIANESVSVRQFEIIIGCSNGLFQKCLSNGTDINTIWLSTIAEKFPQYNTRWLLTGKGEMLLTHDEYEEVPQVYKKKKTIPDKGNEIILLQKECNEKGNRIIALLDENTALRKELEEIKKATE